MTIRSFRRFGVVAAGALAIVATPARADDAPANRSPSVQVQISGAVDAAQVTSAIAAELGVPAISTAVEAACARPCVAVAVDDAAQATIAVTTAAGTVERTLIVPTGDGAAEVIALVVGNLARDEAAALLATLAPTEIAAPPVVAPTVAPPPRAPAAPSTRFGLGLVPWLALDVDRASGSAGVVVDVAIGSRRRIYGFHLAGVASVVVEELRGTEVAGAVGTAGAVRGTQIAGAIARAGSVRGSQLAGAIGVAGQVDGTQVAGAIAIAGDLRGTQVAGAINVARAVHGVQVAGAINVAGRVDGTQVAGAINVADELHGVQVGVVNVARGGDGVSIGLVNVVRGGRTELEATAEPSAIGTLVLRHGSRRWHNVYGVGGRIERGAIDDQVTSDDVWMAGFGMGPSLLRGPTTLDLELMAWNVVYGGRVGDHLDLLGQLRLVAGHRLGPIAAVAGVAIDAYVSTDPHRDRLTAKMPTTASDGARVQIWPTAFVGLRL